MSKAPAPNRRSLLTALLALPVLGQASSASENKSSAQLTGLFSNRHSAAVLGQAYLQQRPEEADTGKLESLVLSPDNLEILASGGTHLGHSGTREIKTAFQNIRRRDFDEGAVANIGGCMLSVTELRLCALVALR